MTTAQAESGLFDVLYQIQALTNPRLKNEVGHLELISRADIHAPDDYTDSHRFGRAIKDAGCPGLRDHSVRMPGSHCRALMTPRPVLSIIQTAHYERVWNRPITSVSKISEA
ncbi:RES family NAD+ phosphorylase [Pseudomonas mohnii]|uniref:RES domain-containing protein n=1 Tax=Pseudomonas mohnii TaxID=395600 RepID=UPI0018DB160C|nr:RES family NAD+ phosphorylase [Pseudomonas mohnii]